MSKTEQAVVPTALSDLLARLDTAAPKPVAVDVDGLGIFYVMPLTVAEVDAIEDDTPADGEPKKHGVVRGIVRALCDENGQRFGPVPELVAALERQSWARLKPLTDAIKAAQGNG